MQARLRAFIAIDIPQSLRAQLSTLQEHLRDLNLDGRTVRPQSLHLTLKFLGDVEELKLQAIEGALKPVARQHEAFTLRPQGLSGFPRLDRPRALFVGLRHSAALVALQTEVEAALRVAGFPSENRAYRPHLTLIRLKSPKGVRLALSRLAELTRGGFDTFPVSSFHLFKSELKPTGAEYARLRTWNLKANASSRSHRHDED